MNSFEQGVALHQAKREPGEIDMVNCVRNILMTNGLGQRISAFNDHQFIQEAADKKPPVQQHYLNRFWNTQLLAANKVSIDERFCLLPNGTPENWLQMFELKVLPFIVENDLPKVI